MGWLTCTILLLASWLSHSGAQTSVSNLDDGSTVCDKNWMFFNGSCYFFSDAEDSVNPVNVPERCLLSDAEYAYPQSPEELSFFQSVGEGKNTYGWSINIERNDWADTFAHVQIHKALADYKEYFTPLPGTIPQFQESYDKDNKCVAFHGFSTRKSDISTEPCDVKLWVVCQAIASDFPDQVTDYVKWFSHEDHVFWLSGKMATQAEANTLCKDKNMELIYNVVELMDRLIGIYDDTPWWTGITLDQNELKLESGDKANLTDISWLPVIHNSPSSHTVLLHSGKARYVRYNERHDKIMGLPYICKKRAFAKGSFGCPVHWVRGGRSCYFLSRNSTWPKAKESCEARGSHLLSINSLDEKLWVEMVIFNHFSTTWTSGNDLTIEGKFTWHDGSDIDNKLLPWIKAPFDEYWIMYEMMCVSFDTTRNEIYGSSCDDLATAACQYPLADGETECRDNWQELNGTCYFIDITSPMISYGSLNQYCKHIAENSYAHPLVVKTKKVSDFLSKYPASPDEYFYVWLGMTVDDTMDSWRWQYGPRDKVDFSVFDVKDEPDNGNGGESENCLAVNKMMKAYDATCDHHYPYICEKDLAPVSVLGPKPDSVASLRVMTFVPIASALTGALVIQWL